MPQRQIPDHTWRRYLLPASIILNAFLLAYNAGRLLYHDGYLPQRQAPATVVEAMLASAASALSPADAEVFHRVMSVDQPRYEPAARRLALARATLARQITTEPYDSQAVLRAFKAWQQSWNELNDVLQGPLVDAMGQLSADGRHRLVEQRRKLHPANDYLSAPASPANPR